MEVLGVKPCFDPLLPERLAEHVDLIAERMFELVLVHVPLYRTLRDDERIAFRQAQRDGFLASMILWRDGRLATPEELAPHRAVGAARAAEGRPLAAVLRAYRLGSIAIFEYATREALPDLPAVELANVTRLILGFSDQMANELTIGYTEASNTLAAQQGHARRELFEDLIAGRFEATSTIVERASFLGITLPTLPSITVANPPAGDSATPTLPDRAELLLHKIRRERPGLSVLSLISRGRLVLVSETIETEPLESALRDSRLNAVTLHAGELGSVPAAYELALQVSTVLSHENLPGRRLVGDAEARFISRLARSQADDDAVDRMILGPLLEPDHEDLLATLDAYLLAGNSVSAASVLRIHPQTMRHRLRRIRTLTGRDPARGWDRFLLETSLRVHQMAHPTPPGRKR